MMHEKTFLIIGEVLKADCDSAGIQDLRPAKRLNEHLLKFAGKFCEELKIWFKDSSNSVVEDFTEIAANIWMLKIKLPDQGKIHFPLKFQTQSWVFEIDMSTGYLSYCLDFSGYLDELITTKKVETQFSKND